MMKYLKWRLWMATSRLDSTEKRHALWVTMSSLRGKRVCFSSNMSWTPSTDRLALWSRSFRCAKALHRDKRLFLTEEMRSLKTERDFSIRHVRQFASCPLRMTSVTVAGSASTHRTNQCVSSCMLSLSRCLLGGLTAVTYRWSDMAKY